MSGEKDFVEVTLKLPKAVADYFRDNKEPLEERLVKELVEVAFAQVETVNADVLMDKYGLKPVFKEYGVLPCYYEEDEAK